MQLKDISPDAVVYYSIGPFDLNATIVFTWGIMALLVITSMIVTANLSTTGKMGRLQNMLEIIVQGMRDQIREISGGQEPGIYLPFIGTLFLFILVSNILAVVPGFQPPTASLSTTAALAICVFLAVFIYGIAKQGVAGYFKHYLKPTPIMLPFNIIGEFSRTLALAVRLFGNMMSGVKIAGILLIVVPLIFPVVMQVLGLLTGVIQAYIFAVLAMVYIASATRTHMESQQKAEAQEQGESDNG